DGPVGDVAGDDLRGGEVLGVESADHGAGDLVRPHGDGLRFDHRRHLDDVGKRAHALYRGVALVAVENAAGDVDVAVEPQDAAEQLRPEAVHHGHDDDQHRHGQGDADKGNH